MIRETMRKFSVLAICALFASSSISTQTAHGQESLLKDVMDLKSSYAAMASDVKALKGQVQMLSLDINRLENTINELKDALDEAKTVPIGEAPPKVLPTPPQGAAPDVPRTVQWAQPGVAVMQPQAMAQRSLMIQASSSCAGGSCGSGGAGMIRGRLRFR